MKTIRTLSLVGALAMASLVAWSELATARGGRGGGGGGMRGGGGRPSMGHVGGGGGRPAMGGGHSMARPQASRPNVQRPSMSNAARPNVSRPNVAARPGGGGNFHPSGGRPSISRPTGGGTPGIANRPTVRPPSNVGPTTRPSLPGGGLAGGNRPNLGNRPGTGGPSLGNRPGGGDRPSLAGITRPSPLPGGGDRPGIGGGGNRPGGGDRPGIGGGGNRPGGGDRPIIGGGGNRPGGGDRPGRPNRPGIGDGNINIGNDINIGSGNIIGSRPSWDRPNWNNPNWGWGGGWAGNWHDHCIHPHWGWYNGCWSGYWGSNWYAPLAWGAVGWGLGALTSGWGYGSSYYNPYYTDTAAAAPYDYSQPVVVNNYVSSDTAAGDPAAVAADDPAATQATKLFDEGLALFKTADYRGALAKFDAALQKLPGDPVVHEVRALTLFALGDYAASAAALNSFLSSAPGMDWTTMSSLYGSIDDYKAQLRKLEDFCRSNRNDAAAYFVLAYQYLVLGEKDTAIKALEVVVKNQPKDYTAKRMLDALSPAPQPTAVPPTPPQPAAATVAAGDAPQTDLVGKWRAKAGDTTIDLAITDDSQFTWKASQGGKPAAELSGQLQASGDTLLLASEKQGSMAGSVKSLGPDKWQFALSGAPASDPGLSFQRVN